jgi:hypothetical protein
LAPPLVCSCKACRTCIPIDSLPNPRIRVLRGMEVLDQTGDFARVRVTLTLHTIDDTTEQIANVRLNLGRLFAPTRAAARHGKCVADSGGKKRTGCTCLRVEPGPPGVVEFRVYPVAPGTVTVATLEGFAFRPFGFGYRLYRTGGVVAVVAPDDSIEFVTRDEAYRRFPRVEPVSLDGIRALRRSAKRMLKPLVVGRPPTRLPGCGHVRRSSFYLPPPPPPPDPRPPPKIPLPRGNPPARE